MCCDACPVCKKSVPANEAFTYRGLHEDCWVLGGLTVSELAQGIGKKTEKGVKTMPRIWLTPERFGGRTSGARKPQHNSLWSAS